MILGLANLPLRKILDLTIMARSRSRSPDRSTSSKTRIERGFKWKDTKSRAEPEEKAPHHGEGDDRRRERKEHKREHREHRDRSDREERRERENKKVKKAPEEAAARESSTADSNVINDLKIASKFGAKAAAKVKPIQPAAQEVVDSDSTVVSGSRSGASAATSKSKVPTGPMILVTVNDRLGTKKEVPCLGSDTIGDFKKLVAMQIGRQPHEIMLKRQSERPLKDYLTLDDYEISSGVQLDLELNTGD